MRMTLLAVDERECGRSTGDDWGSPKIVGLNRRSGVGEIISTGSSVRSSVSGAVCALSVAPGVSMLLCFCASITGPGCSTCACELCFDSSGSSVLFLHPFRRLESCAIGDRLTARVRGASTDSLGVGGADTSPDVLGSSSVDVMFESGLIGCSSAFCCISVDKPRCDDVSFQTV